jgi:hypothetical protein
MTRMGHRNPAQEEASRRRRLRTGKPTEADAPSPGSGRGPEPLPGQSDIWVQLDGITTERPGREEPPAK